MTQVLSSPPSTLSVFSRALLSLARRPTSTEVPELALTLREARSDDAKLAAYREVCGFAASPYLPLTWPHILAFPLRMTLMGDARFPFPLPGLVHLTNRTVQTRAIQRDEPLQLDVRLGASRPHEKGTLFSLISLGSVRGEQVWEDESAILFRGKPGLGVQAARDDDDQPVEAPDTTTRWELPEDLGRRYAQASGDFNPIHLHALSARAFGFKRAIAHGMWSAARGLAQLSVHDPAQPMSYRVWFKLPVFLPSSVSYREQRLGNGARFETRDERGEKPHARGLLTLG